MVQSARWTSVQDEWTAGECHGPGGDPQSLLWLGPGIPAGKLPGGKLPGKFPGKQCGHATAVQEDGHPVGVHARIGDRQHTGGRIKIHQRYWTNFLSFSAKIFEFWANSLSFWADFLRLWIIFLSFIANLSSFLVPLLIVFFQKSCLSFKMEVLDFTRKALRFLDRKLNHETIRSYNFILEVVGSCQKYFFSKLKFWVSSTWVFNQFPEYLGYIYTMGFFFYKMAVLEKSILDISRKELSS